MTTGFNLNKLKALLKDTSALSGLSDEALGQIVGRCEFIQIGLGRTVYRTGDEAGAFFIIYSGRVRILDDKARGEQITLDVLEAGDHFGEQELLANSQRLYTARAAGNVALLKLSKEDFNHLLGTNKSLGEKLSKHVDNASVRYFLKLNTSFSSLSAPEIGKLSSLLRPQQYAANQTIIKAGDNDQALYILRDGSARMVSENAGQDAILCFTPGDHFSDTSLSSTPGNASAIIANENCSVFCLDRSDLDLVISSAPTIAEAIVSGTAVGTRPVATDPSSTGFEFQPAPTPEEGVCPRRRARRYPALMQVSETDCAAACLAMILRYYGKHVSINRLRELANVGRDGASLYDAAAAAEALGFRTRSIRAADPSLDKIGLPAIAHWQGFHYIVVYEVTRDHVVVADPAVGLRRLARAEFARGWTGYLILLAPTPSIENVKESKTAFGRFLPLLMPYRKLLFEILLCSLGLQLFGLASPIFMQVIVDKALVYKNANMLNVLLMGMIIVAVFQTATMGLRQYLMVHTTRRIDLEMMVAFYRHVLSLSMRYFQDRRVGDILKRFGENEKIRELLTGRALTVVLDCVMIVVYLGMMFYYNVSLTLVVLAFIPGYAGLTFVMTPIMKRQSRLSFERAAEAESHMVESVTAIGTVKETAAERAIRWKWEGLMIKALNVEFQGALTNIAASSAGNILQTLNTTFLLWYGAHQVISGDLSLGQLMAFNALVGNVTRPMLGMIELWHDLQEVNIAFERINDVFDSKPEDDPAEKMLINVPAMRGHIRFENVTFRYPTRGDKNALQNICLEIQPGQTVALVGRSGAGKTTFANLLLRLHEANEGKVLIDGHDLRQVSLSSLRSQIGVVSQEVFLFSGTIKENIAFGAPDAPLERVSAAAALAGAHEFISKLPLGYDTRIGERGQSMSGGQRQRIAIARALFKEPRVLIFDEATSALDTESERAIQKNFDTILKDRTTLVIAHRLSTVRNADLIVVLDNGLIVETGTHDSLMRQGGLYCHLSSQQMEA